MLPTLVFDVAMPIVAPKVLNRDGVSTLLSRRRGRASGASAPR